MNEYIADSSSSLEESIAGIRSNWEEDKYLIITVKPGKQRSGLQNNSLHLYLANLSKALNAAGFDMKRVLKEEVDIPWDNDGKMAKKYLWKSLQKVLTGVSRTRDLNRKQCSYVYEVLDRHIAEKFGLSVPWPHKEIKP